MVCFIIATSKSITSIRKTSDIKKERCEIPQVMVGVIELQLFRYTKDI